MKKIIILSVFVLLTMLNNNTQAQKWVYLQPWQTVCGQMPDSTFWQKILPPPQQKPDKKMPASSITSSFNTNYWVNYTVQETPPPYTGWYGHSKRLSWLLPLLLLFLLLGLLVYWIIHRINQTPLPAVAPPSNTPPSSPGINDVIISLLKEKGWAISVKKDGSYDVFFNEEKKPTEVIKEGSKEQQS